MSKYSNLQEVLSQYKCNICDGTGMTVCPSSTGDIIKISCYSCISSSGIRGTIDIKFIESLLEMFNK